MTPAGQSEDVNFCISFDGIATLKALILLLIGSSWISVTLTFNLTLSLIYLWILSREQVVFTLPMKAKEGLLAASNGMIWELLGMAASSGTNLASCDYSLLCLVSLFLCSVTVIVLIGSY